MRFGIKGILFLIILAGFALSGMAQRPGNGKKREEMRKELEEFKMKFIAQEMDLKESQQKQFFEVYGQMQDERIRLFEQTRALERKLKRNPDATEADYAAMSKAITEAKQKDAEIEEKYDAKFAMFLSGKQIFKMKDAEEKFRRKMHQMVHKKRKK